MTIDQLLPWIGCALYCLGAIGFLVIVDAWMEHTSEDGNQDNPLSRGGRQPDPDIALPQRPTLVIRTDRQCRNRSIP